MTTARPVAATKKTAAPVPLSNAAVQAAVRAGTKPIPEQRQRVAAQDLVGNSAVAAAQDTRQETRRRGPGTDPKFGALKKDVQQKKRSVATSHPPPRAEATSAQDAALPPKDDEQAQGKTANAEKMNGAKPKEFDKAAFIAAVEKAIEAKAPKNLDEADKFGESGKAEEVKGEVQGRVGEGKTDSADQIATTTAAPPDTSAAEAKKVVPMAPDRPPGAPATPNPANATPDQLPPSATDMSAGPAQVNQQMTDAQVTETQLRKSNEPQFGNALQEKKTAEQHAETAPGELRKGEAAQLKASTAQARTLGASAMNAMRGRRVATGQDVGTGKTGAKSADEEKRTQVTALLQKVFDTMKTDVEAVLSGLDKLVDDQFTRGEQDARTQFTLEYTRKIQEYKDRRYSGLDGKFRWVRDLFAGLPDEVDRFYDEARAGYIRRMRAVISDVATTIGNELNRAKQRIAQGRAEMQTEVRNLPKDLQAIGKQAAAGFADRFDELTQSVDDKGTELVDTLATKYTDAVKAVDDEIAAEKEKNKGLIAKAIDAIKSVINTILELKRLLLTILAKAAQAVLGILADPIGFLGNLVTAVGAGLRLFMRNIGRHLQEGILSWLLGRTAEAGLQLPAKFDARGVLLMIAGLLGLSWPSIRARIARKVPEQALVAAETAVPLVQQVRRQGVAGMWDDLRTRVGDLRRELIDKVIQYVTPVIIIAGITWLLSLLNPASAFVRAVKLIIDIVKFVVTQARQIYEFVNAVLDAVIAIARGSGGGVPGMVERALARSIPLLLGLFAAILGIGGVAAKVKQIVQAMARPVNRAVDGVVDKIVGMVRKLLTKLKSTPDKPGAGKPKRDRKKPAAKQRRPDRPRSKPKSKERPKPKKKQQDYGRVLDAALRDARALLAKGMPVDEIKTRLPAIRRRHKLTRLDVVVERIHGEFHVIHFVAAVNPMKKTRPENAPLGRRKARLEAGLLIRNQRKFQDFADTHNLVVEVRLTNPDSVRHLEAGALYKPREIKPKTINDADMLLSVEPEKKGLVGFFKNRPPEPKKHGLPRQQQALGRKRFRQRDDERKELGPTMRKLARGPKGPSRYDVIGYVVYGYTKKGQPRPVAGDHDLYDMYRPDGTRLPDDERFPLLADMIRRGFGVMHGTVVYWHDWAKRDDKEWKARTKLMEQAQEEGVVRFAPGQPMRWVRPSTPLWDRPYHWAPPAGRSDT